MEFQEFMIERFNRYNLQFEGNKLYEVKLGSISYIIYQIAYTNNVVVSLKGEIPPQAYICYNFHKLAEVLSFINITDRVQEEIIMKTSFLQT